MVLAPPPRVLDFTALFFFIFHFLFKVCQTPLKSVNLSPFILSVILGRKTKSLKIVLRKTPHTLDLTQIFFLLFLGFKVCQTLLKNVYLSLFVRPVIFGRIPISLKMVTLQTPLTLDFTLPLFFFGLKSAKRLSKCVPVTICLICYFGKDT